MDGDGEELAVVLRYCVVDGILSGGAVHAAYAGIFLDDGALGVVGDAVAVKPFAAGTGIDNVIVFFYFVARSESEKGY